MAGETDLARFHDIVTGALPRSCGAATRSAVRQLADAGGRGQSAAALASRTVHTRRRAS